MRINKFFDSIVEQLVLDSLTKMHEKLRLAVLPLMVIDALFEAWNLIDHPEWISPSHVFCYLTFGCCIFLQFDVPHFCFHL